MSLRLENFCTEEFKSLIENNHLRGAGYRDTYNKALGVCISGVGDAIGKGMKAVSKTGKVAKYLSKAKKIIEVTQAFLDGADALNPILTSINGIKDVGILIWNGEFDITHREHIDMLVESG